MESRALDWQFSSLLSVVQGRTSQRNHRGPTQLDFGHRGHPFAACRRIDCRLGLGHDSDRHFEKCCARGGGGRCEFGPQYDELDLKLAHGMLWGALVGGCLEMLFLASIGSFDAKVDTLSWTLAVAIGWSVWRAGAKCQPSFSCFVATASTPVIALLVSGSWQASGIAIPFLCACATLWAKPILRWPAAASNPIDAGLAGSKWAGNRWIATGFAIVGCMIFGFQTWRPVMNAWMWSVQAESARSLPEQVRLISEAAASDPLNRGLQLQLAQWKPFKLNWPMHPKTFLLMHAWSWNI